MGQPLATASMRPAAALPPAGRGRRATNPTWMDHGTGGSTLVPQRLQQPPSIGVQHGGARPAATATMHPVEALRQERRSGQPLGMGK